MAKAQFGLNLAESKMPLVYSRLSNRLKARCVNGFSEYLELINKPQEAEELLELISALTTNVTSFFREKHHFEMLETEILPNLIQHVKSGGRARLWSAGCSSGQEPYSLAMTVMDKFPDALNYDIRVLATDIDPKIVAYAKDGAYPKEEIDTIPDHLGHFIHHMNENQSGKSKIVEKIKSLVTFGELNLIAEWPCKGNFDVIFCRNVAIYFDQPTQQKLWARFTERLVDGGHLFIGHSERITGPAEAKMQGVGITSYQKHACAPSTNITRREP
jgi:chemotaxis protein methyltransferase CheR